MKSLARARVVCACQRHTIDSHGDHIHTCPKYSGAKPAHELVVEAVARLARSAGFSDKTRNVTVARGCQCGDDEIQHLHIAGKASLVIDVTIVHTGFIFEMSGNCNGINVALNGQFRARAIRCWRTQPKPRTRSTVRHTPAVVFRRRSSLLCSPLPAGFTVSFSGSFGSWQIVKLGRTSTTLGLQDHHQPRHSSGSGPSTSTRIGPSSLGRWLKPPSFVPNLS